MDQYYSDVFTSRLFRSVQSEISSFSSSESSQSSYQEVASGIAGFLILLSSLVLLCLSLRDWKSPAANSDSRSRQLTSIDDVISTKFALGLPCRKCYYFNTNRHLPCAVNPMHVLKKESLNCPNFQPKDGDMSDEFL